MSHPRVAFRLAVAFITAPWIAGSISAQTPEPASASEDPVIELSPFTVTSDDDRGYAPGSTLMGSRTKTSLRDVANPLDIFTKDLIQDLAITDIQGLTEFASGVSPNSGGTFNGDGQEREIWSYNQMVIRGFKVSRAATRNFVDFNGVVFFDSYNSDRVEFSKGPNSILFGAGEAGGTVNSATKVANVQRNAGNVQLRVDNEGSVRGTLDYNHVFLKDRFAVRLSALKQNMGFDRGPSYDRAEALHLTTSYKILPETTLTLAHEYFDSHRASPKGVIPQDNYTPYHLAGSQRVTGVSGSNVFINGSTTPVSAASVGLRTQNNTLGIMVLDNGTLRNIAGTATGSNRTVNGESTVDIRAEEIGYPHNRVIGGANGFNFTRYKITEANLSHKVIENLYADLSWTYMASNTRQGHSVSNSLMVDPNDFGENKNFGKYYVEYRPFWIQRDFNILNLRGTLSYDLNLARKNRWLGNHRIAGMLERNNRLEVWDNGRLTLISTPAGPVNPNNYGDKLRNGGLAVFVRDYLDFDNGDYSLSDISSMMWTEGITQNGYVARFVPRDSYAYLKKRTIQNTKMGVLQSRWMDRLVTTFGWRDDRRKTLEAPIIADPVTGLYRPETLVQGAVANSAGIYRAADAVFTAPAKEVGGISRNYGAVGHITKWLSLSYSYATNFSPAAESKGIDDQFLPPSMGKGRDYGVRFHFLDDRIMLNIIRFKTSEEGTAINGGSYNSPQADLYAVEGILVDRGIVQARRIGSGAFTTADTTSKGYEVNLIANPNEHWNFRVAASETIARLTNLAPDVSAFYEQYRASYSSLDPTLTSNSGITPLGTYLANIDNNYALMRARENAQNFPSSRYSVRFTGKYSFGRNHRLKGFSVGANYRWNSAPVIGYYRTTNEKGSPFFDVSRPAEGDAENIFDLFFIYNMKVSQRYSLRFQLNVNNVFGDDEPVPVRQINDRDAGDFKWVTTRYRPATPQSVVFSTTLGF
ncbi:MAG: TonB-dependent receptor plug domain-containing protein [Opitutaceae bacterium]|nr:TonB-dependent receptor plug domain-containing protein [Opitutaceae bacterium]